MSVTITLAGLNSTETGQILENPVVSSGDFRFTNNGQDFVNLPATVRGMVVDVVLSDEQANDPLGYLYFKQVVPANPPEPVETWSSGIEVGPLRRLESINEATFKITPSTLKSGPLIGQSLVFTSSVNGRSIPRHTALAITVNALIKANGSVEITDEQEFEFEEFGLGDLTSYYEVNFDTELENSATEEPISLEPGDSMLAVVQHRLNGGKLFNQLLSIPILRSPVEAILENPNVPLANNTQGQLEASNVTVQVASGGSLHTPQNVVDALLQFLINSQVWPDGTFARAVQDANKFGQSRVIDTTEPDPDDHTVRTFDEQPISE